MIIPSTETGTIGALNAAFTVDIEGADHVAIQATGTWVGTITPEISLYGTNWVATGVKSSTSTSLVTVVTSFTANGIYQIHATGIPSLRLRMSAYTSGTATITVHADRISK